MILTFITISQNINELISTRKSILDTMSTSKINFNMIFVVPENEEFLKKIKNNILDNQSEYLCFDKSQGVYNALNIGIEKAKLINTTHISFINGGDFLEIGFLKSLDIAMKGLNIIVGGYANLLDVNYEKTGRICKGGKQKWNISHPGSIYPLSVFRNRQYNNNLKISADWHLNYEIRSFYDFRINKQIVSSFNLGGISQSKNNIQILLLDEFKILKSNILNYFNPKNIFYLVRLIALFFRLSKNLLITNFSKIFDRL